MRRCFAGYKLRDLSVGVTLEVVRRVRSVWSDDMSTEEMQSAICDGFVAGDEVVVGEDCH